MDYSDYSTSRENGYFPEPPFLARNWHLSGKVTYQALGPNDDRFSIVCLEAALIGNSHIGGGPISAASCRDFSGGF